MIIGMLVLIVMAYYWLCPSTNETKTFTDGVMSFNYPADFDNSSFVINDSNSSLRVIGKLENTAPLKGQVIWVDKNISATSSAETRDKLVSQVQNMSKTEKLISISTETNPNGIVVERVIHTDDQVNPGTQIRYNELFFQINDSVYRILISGYEDKQEAIDNTNNIIFQSIKEH